MAKVQLVNPTHRRMMRRWQLPEGHSAKEIVMRELDSADDIAAAINADKFGPRQSYQHAETALQVVQRERVRLSIVQVDGRRVNADGLPFMEFDNWCLRTTRFVEARFLELNHFTEEEVAADLAAFKAGGEVVLPSELAPLVDTADSIGAQSSG